MNHPAFSLIKSAYCLNLDKNPGRWDKSFIAFQMVGLYNVDRIVTHESEDNRYLSFNQAHYDAVKSGYETGEPFAVFEDDIGFDPNWKRLEEATAQLPADWDLLFLGANIIGEGMNWKMPVKYSDNLACLHNAWMTHAIVYSNKMAKWVLDTFDPTKFPVYDEWLRVNVMTVRNVYLINPMICYQRPGYSDVWQKEVAYGSHKEGNEWMKKNL